MFGNDLLLKTVYLFGFVPWSVVFSEKTIVKCIGTIDLFLAVKGSGSDVFL